ncbi:MAG: hypothetical protein ACE5LU_00415 [Anaerolineae bacterium]
MPEILSGQGDLEFVTLRARGYRVLAIKPANIDERLEELAGRLQL